MKTPEPTTDHMAGAKDGRDVLIFFPGDHVAFVAHWGDYPGNPVAGPNDTECYLEGWVTDCDLRIGQEEEGFFGWEDDPMPTAWCEVPNIQKV